MVVRCWQLILYTRQSRFCIKLGVVWGSLVCNMYALFLKELTIETAVFLCKFLLQHRHCWGARSVYGHDGKASYMKVHLLPDQGSLFLHCQDSSLNQQMTKLKGRVGLDEQIPCLYSWDGYKLHQRVHYLCPWEHMRRCKMMRSRSLPAIHRLILIGNTNKCPIFINWIYFHTKENWNLIVHFQGPKKKKTKKHSKPPSLFHRDYLIY